MTIGARRLAGQVEKCEGRPWFRRREKSSRRMAGGSRRRRGDQPSRSWADTLCCCLSTSFAFRHEEALHGHAPVEAAEEGGRGALGQFIAFGRLFPVTIGFAQWVQHNPLRILFLKFGRKASVPGNWATRCRRQGFPGGIGWLQIELLRQTLWR